MKNCRWATIGMSVMVILGLNRTSFAENSRSEPVLNVNRTTEVIPAGRPGGAKESARSAKKPAFVCTDPLMMPTAPATNTSLVGKAEQLGGKLLDDALQTAIPWKDEFHVAVSEEKAPGKRYIFGQDDRSYVANTAVYPYSAVCQLELTFPKGTAIGTGFFTSYRTVMTCGHCVFDRGLGGWATRIRVIPGRNGSYAPFGSAWASQIFSVKGWTVNNDRGYDIGAVVLSDATLANKTGHFGYASLSTATLTNRYSTFGTSGFPGDKGGIYMFSTSGSFVAADATKLYYYFDTKGGQSGSPIWYRDSQGGRYAVGIVSAEYRDGSAPNIATRIRSDLFNWMRSLP